MSFTKTFVKLTYVFNTIMKIFGPSRKIKKKILDSPLTTTEYEKSIKAGVNHKKYLWTRNVKIIISKRWNGVFGNRKLITDRSEVISFLEAFSY